MTGIPMTSTATTLPLVKAELDLLPSTPPPPSEDLHVKQEPQELAVSNAIHPPPLPSPTMTTNNPQKHQSPPPHEPKFIDSITQLRDLSVSLSTFQRCYDKLHQHLDYIRSTIDSQLPQHLQNRDTISVTTTSTIAPPANPLAIIPQPESPSTKPPLPEPTNSAPIATTNSTQSELEHLCVTMCGRGLRRYMASHISDIKKLREEVTLALKVAPDPAKLVLECIGKFYLQGSKAYTKNSPMIPGREVSILVLECFLLMGTDGVTIDPTLKGETDIAAVAWRKRLTNEGGLGKASEMDARGLLLFIGCFGIPNVFKNEDIRDLIRVSNAREFSGALRGSPVLLARIPGILEGMVKNKLEVEAVDIAFTFGLEDKFSPQTILTSFLRDSKETWTTIRKAAKGSFPALNEANKKHLADLKSVINCLENHKIDPSKLLPGWQVHKKILSLEKDIADEKGDKTATKRKADETESSKKLKAKDVKRTKFLGHGLQQKAAAHVERRSPYGILGPTSLLDGGLPSHMSSFSPSPSMLHASGAGSLPENVACSTGGSGVGLLAAAGIRAAGSAGTAGVLPTGSYAGIHGGLPVDTVGYAMSSSGEPYGWRGDAVPNERLVGQSFAGHPSAMGVNGFYRLTQLEGFAGLPNSSSVAVSSRRSTSDLYQFADAVL